MVDGETAGVAAEVLEILAFIVILGGEAAITATRRTAGGQILIEVLRCREERTPRAATTGALRRATLPRLDPARRCRHIPAVFGEDREVHFAIEATHVVVRLDALLAVVTGGDVITERFRAATDVHVVVL